MSAIKVKSGKEADARMVEVQYDFSTSVSSAVDRYGEEQVLALINRAVTLGIQALARQKLTAGVDDASLQHAVDSYQPGVRAAATKAAPKDRAAAALAKLSEEELAEILAQYKKKKG